MIAVWEKNFGLPDPITAEKMATLETDFVNAAKQQVKFGPSSVSDFTKWKACTGSYETLGETLFLVLPSDI